MIENQYAHRIKPAHLARKAVVYLRQSSPKQVQENKESQGLQYALVERARALGWSAIEVIDCDLGTSATVGAPLREGFERLIASVALGEVGVVLSRELSRLLRTDKDFCQLVEVCQVFGTLVGDSEQIYDPNVLDDQLVLGIKGTLSVVELKVLKLRLLEGMEAKARRGELVRLLPPGYVRDATGKVVKDPDARVREAMALLFRKFQEIRSIRQTFLWFQAEGVELPVNKPRARPKGLAWQVPTLSFISNALHNPFYAGTYVWGQRPVELKLVEGRLLKHQGRVRRAEECKVSIRDHHEGYIDWETYQENLRFMRDNYLQQGGDEAVAAVRAGQGLLCGLLRCARCGHKLQVRYWGKSGTGARYLCIGDFPSGGRYCLGFGAVVVDRRLSQEVLRTISPLGVRASLAAIERLTDRRDEAREALERQLEESEYESRRAFEQYNEVDPRNRLVAAELERRWNAKLEDVETLRTRLEESKSAIGPLSEQDAAAIVELGDGFAGVWESESCPIELKKKILRTVVEEVIVDCDESKEQLRFVIHWTGGAHTLLEMPRPRSAAGQKTAMEDVEIIRRLAVRYGDDQIARVLVKLGRRSAKGKRWSEVRVRWTRRTYSIPGQRRGTIDPDLLTKHQAAKYCGVSVTTIQRLVASGLLKNSQEVPWAPWEIRRPDLDSEPVRRVLQRLRETGRLEIEGDGSTVQTDLFP